MHQLCHFCVQVYSTHPVVHADQSILHITSHRTTGALSSHLTRARELQKTKKLRKLNQVFNQLTRSLNLWQEKGGKEGTIKRREKVKKETPPKREEKIQLIFHRVTLNLIEPSLEIPSVIKWATQPPPTTTDTTGMTICNRAPPSSINDPIITLEAIGCCYPWHSSTAVVAAD